MASSKRSQIKHAAKQGGKSKPTQKSSADLHNKDAQKKDLQSKFAQRLKKDK